MFRLSFSGVWLIFLTLFTLAPAFAQPFPERAPLRGIVVDQDNKPISGAFIVVRRQNDMGAFAFWGGEAQTDASGQWAIPDAEEGAYYINAEAKGFATKFNVGFDWKKSSVPFRTQLQRMVKPRLKFTNVDGSVLANTPVYLNLQGIEGEGIAQQTGRTDANGILTTGDFTPSRYRLYASAESGYYLNPSLEIKPNADTEPIEVTLQKGATLRAKIADANGRAIGGANFSLSPVVDNEAIGQGPVVGENVAILAAGGEQSLLSSHDGDGLIQLQNLPAGNYTARFTAPGLTANGNETGAHAVRTLELKNGETTEISWTSTPKRYSTLVLDVTTPSGKPFTGTDLIVRILAVSGNGSIFGNNEEGEGSFPGAGGTRRVTPDANGRAMLYPLRSGRYRIFVAAANTPSSSSNTRGRGNAVREVGPLDVMIPTGSTPAGGSGSATVVLDEIK